MNPVTFLTSTEAAAAVGVAPRTILDWYKTGKADKLQPQAITTHGYLLFSEEDVRAYALKRAEAKRRSAA